MRWIDRLLMWYLRRRGLRIVGETQMRMRDAELRALRTYRRVVMTRGKAAGIRPVNRLVLRELAVAAARSPSPRPSPLKAIRGVRKNGTAG